MLLYFQDNPNHQGHLISFLDWRKTSWMLLLSPREHEIAVFKGTSYLSCLMIWNGKHQMCGCEQLQAHEEAFVQHPQTHNDSMESQKAKHREPTHLSQRYPEPSTEKALHLHHCNTLLTASLLAWPRMRAMHSPLSMWFVCLTLLHHSMNKRSTV